MEERQEQPTVKSKRPSNNPLKQQRLWAFQPIHTFKSTVIIFLILLAIFITFGLLLLLSALNVHEYSTRYDNKSNCAQTKWNRATWCEVELDIEEKMTEPVYFYYELRNFYQNHRMYVKSRDDKQLAALVDEGDSKKCDPVQDMKDVGPRCLTGYCSIKNTTLLPNDYANPCGLVARSLFNGKPHTDTYSLSLSGRRIPISEEDIAWESDTDFVFKAADDEGTQWTDVENEHFAVWMRIAAFPTFRKLWGIVKEDLEKGKYTVRVASMYDVSPWDGEKHIVVSTANRFGGRNPFIGIVYLCAAGIAFLMLLVFILRGLCRKKEEIDLNNLKWD